MSGLSNEARSLVGGSWGAGPGDPALVTYAFAADGDTPFGPLPPGEWAPFTETQKAGIREALARWSAVCGLSFVEVADRPGSDLFQTRLIDIRIHLQVIEGGDGFAGFPTDGDVFLNLASLAGSDFAPGSHGFHIALHEIGHAIGLKHPFEGAVQLPPELLFNAYTVMSYDFTSSATAPGSIDREAVAYIYGTEEAEPGRQVQRSWNAAADAVEQRGTDAGERFLFAAIGNLSFGEGGDDTIAGWTGSDSLHGGAGNDRLFGYSGRDLLAGGEGDDVLLAGVMDGIGAATLEGGAGHDIIRGFVGRDQVSGGEGDDTIMLGARLGVSGGLAGDAGLDLLDASAAEAAFALNMVDGTIRHWNDQRASLATGIERVRGSAHDDTVVGPSASAVTIEGGLGGDFINAAGRLETVIDYSAAPAGVLLWFHLIEGFFSSPNGGWDGYGHADTLREVRSVIGSDVGHDRMTGGAPAEWFRGGGGLDTLSGGDGDDSLDGGDGDDELLGGAGADALLGGDGIDVASYEGAAAVVASLVSPGMNTGPAAGDTYSGIENLRGSRRADQLVAGIGDNRIEGLAGNDTAIGGDGDDSLDGGTGSDLLAGGPGNDSLSGGEDVDEVVGGAGNDSLDGGANASSGGDFLFGGTGDDTYIVDSGLDLVDEGNLPAYAAYGFGGTDTIIVKANFFWDLYSVAEVLRIDPNATDPGSAGTTAVGGVFDNTLIGNAGTNILFGRGGSDSYRPGDGVDFVSFSTLGVTDAPGYTARGANTLVVDPRTTGPLSYDIVFEFISGRDKIDVRGYGYPSAAAVLAQGHDDGLGNSYYGLGDGLDYVYVVGLTTAQVSAGDFIV